MKALQWIRRLNRQQLARVLIGFSGTVIANSIIAVVGKQVLQMAVSGILS